jgi:hypothetical protein
LRKFIDTTAKKSAEGCDSRIVILNNYLATRTNKRLAVHLHGSVFQHRKRLLKSAYPLVAIDRWSPIRNSDAEANQEMQRKPNDTHKKGSYSSNNTVLHLVT